MSKDGQDRHINLYLDEHLLEELERRTDGRGRSGWNRSNATRAILRLYLGLASAELPELPEGALAALAKLVRPEDYTEQAFELLPRVVETHPHLDRVCRSEDIDPATLCQSLERLDEIQILTILDHLLLSGGSR